MCEVKYRSPVFVTVQQDVEKFTDIEKLYLYLKLPSGPSSGNDKRYVRDSTVDSSVAAPPCCCHDATVVRLISQAERKKKLSSLSSQFHRDKVWRSFISTFLLIFLGKERGFAAVWLMLMMKQAADLCGHPAIPSCLCFICFPISIHHTHPSSTPPIRPIWTENARGSSTPGLWY